MKRKTDLQEIERIFTLHDVGKLLRRQRKKIFQVALLGAMLASGLTVLKAPRYKAEALFKEGAEQGSSESILRELLPGVRRQQDQEAVVLMKTLPVLKRAVQTLGLQAQVEQKKSFLVTRVLRRVKNNLRAAQGKALIIPASFSFRDVVYEGENSLSYLLRLEGKGSYTIWSDQKTKVCDGVVGERIFFGPISLTLDKVPETASLKRFYPFSIHPWIEAAKHLQNSFNVDTHKQIKSICVLEAFHPDPSYAKHLLDAVMEGYQAHLEGEFEAVSKKQLAYLDRRQNELYEKLSGVLDEKIALTCENIEEGFVRSEDGIQGIIDMYKDLAQRDFSLDLSLARLEEFAKNRTSLPPDGPLFQGSSAVCATLQELRQDRDWIAISLQDQSYLPVSFSDLQGKKRELEELRKRQKVTRDWLAHRSQNTFAEFPLEPSFDLERTLVSLAQNWEPDELLPYFEEHLHLLAVREKMLGETLLQGATPEPIFEGIDLETLRALFVGYNKELDLEEVTIRQAEGFIRELPRADFSLSALSAVLPDPLSQELIQKAVKATTRWKDPDHCGEKEAKRISTERELHKKILQDHLEEIRAVATLRAHLVKEKMSRLQKKMLDVIQRKIGLYEEEISDWVKKSAFSLQKERELLNGKMEQLRGVLKQFPERSKAEGWIKMRAEMGQHMMGTLMQLVESKTLGYHLHQVTASPLEFATVSSFPVPPQILLFSLIGAFLTSLGYAVIALFKTIQRGFPASLARFQALGWPVAGRISSHCDGPEVELLRGEDQETLRRVCLFLDQGDPEKKIEPVAKLHTRGKSRILNQVAEEKHRFSVPADGGLPCRVGEEVGAQPGLKGRFYAVKSFATGSIVSLIGGMGVDYSFALAEMLGCTGEPPVLVRFDFSEKYQAKDQPGVYARISDGKVSPFSLVRHKKKFDFIPAGGYTPHGVEWIRSPDCKRFLEELKEKYSCVLLFFRGPLDHAEARAALRLSDQAIVTATEETAESLTPFLDWSYKDGVCRLHWIVQEREV